MLYFKIFLKKIRLFPSFMLYIFYDFLIYKFYGKDKLYPGWGIHLYTGRFGAGKTSYAVINAYEECVKYPQLSLLTNLSVSNFPPHTKILKLDSIDDILNAPDDCIVLIDEIGTIFNSYDFMRGERAVSKSLFQLICQCRKHRMKIYGTVQKYLFLDKQIRDCSASVTECFSSFRHPFSRMITGITYSTDEYEAMLQNPLYKPRSSYFDVFILTEKYRHLFDTSEMVKGMLEQKMLSDQEIVFNRGTVNFYPDGSKDAQKAYKKSMRSRRR